MALVIDSEEATDLANRLADVRGETVTEAVTVALRERLDRLEKAALVEEILAIGRDCASRMTEPWLSVDHGELLYDEMGLPR